MKRWILFTSLFLLLGAQTTTSVAQTHFTAKLTGAQEVPAVTTEATGTGVFFLDEEGLHYNITITGISTIAASHFHSRERGANGGVVRDITFNGSSASGVWTASDFQALTDSLRAELLAGNIYVNVHTPANTGGEIRGQVNVSAGTTFKADLTGAQEVPGVATDARGTGYFTLTDAGLIYSVTVEGLPTIMAAHFHNNEAGVNGPVVREITFDGNTSTGIWTADDDQALTDNLLLELLTGRIYVNVHTPANTGGEIRGQLNLNSGIGFTATINGSQQNPPVTTDATGTGTFVFTEAGLVYNITIDGLTPTVAHFHRAASGTNGPVVRDLSVTGGTTSGVWREIDSQSLTPALIADLFAGNLYVNFHTAANPGGEIRGQVLGLTGDAFRAKLTGAQEPGGVTTSADGTGSFSLSTSDMSRGLSYSITVEGLEIMAAHFHRGAAGVNGPVVRDLNFVGHTATGTWTDTDGQALSEELLNELLAGNIYVNVHTAGNTGGEIRGQVHPAGGTGFSAKLTGAQEPVQPPVETEATGTGVFTLTEAGLIYQVTIEGIDQIQAAHFHNREPGLNGGVVRDLSFDGNTTSGLWSPDAATQPLTDQLISELFAGNIYVNVHSPQFPGGEIRGQLRLRSGHGFSAVLNGRQENPPVTTNASGTGAFTFTDAGLVFNITVDGLEIMAAHFHNQSVGTNGPVVRDIESEFDGLTAFGVWTSSDDAALTNALIGELVTGDIYVNAHTAANPTGEIRGQLASTDFVTSVTQLNPDVPRDFSLLQNFPNPFNPSTEIRFNLNQSGQTVLKVYNMLGQEVATLVNENLTSGTYSVTFDSRNLPSGVYVYRLDSNGQNQVRKMLLLK